MSSIPYGWRVAGAGAANMSVNSVPTFQASSIIFDAVEEEFGWSRSLTTGVASFGWFSGAMLGPLEGIFTDRFGAGRMALAGFLMGGAGLIAFSQVAGPVSYYLAFLMFSTGFSFGGFTPSMAAVNAWLPHRRATGGAIVIAGSSVAGFGVPLVAWGISAYGWRPTMMVFGIAAVCIAPILARILGKTPASGHNPHVSSERQRKFRTGPIRDFSAGEALRTRAFWAMALAHGMLNLSVAAISAHLFQHLTGPEVGLSDLTASSILPIMAGLSLGFQILGGWCGDGIDKRVPVAALTVCQAMGMVLLAFAGNYLATIAFAVVWSIGYGARTPLLHAMRGEYFGGRHYGAILGISSMPMYAGMMAAPFLAGYVFDVQQTYRWAFIALAGASLLGGLLVLAATRPEPPVHHAEPAGQPQPSEIPNPSTPLAPTP